MRKRDPKTACQRSIILGATLAVVLGLPLGMSASANISKGYFGIKATDSADSTISKIAGQPKLPSTGPEEPVDTDPRGIFSFTVDDSVCQPGQLATTSINFGGLSDNPEITDPDGNTVAVTGKTFVSKNGKWTFRGSFASIRNNTAAGAAGVARCVRSVDKWKDTDTTDLFGAFRASAVDRMVEPPRTVTNMGYMLNTANRFNDPTVKDWDTRNVTNMTNMFQGGGSTMTQDLSNWNVCQIPTRPAFFKTDFNAAIEPQWGTPCK